VNEMCQMFKFFSVFMFHEQDMFLYILQLGRCARAQALHPPCHQARASARHWPART
jgi:hypothetical protein